MRVKDYKNVQAVVNRLRDIATHSNETSTVIADNTIMADKYKLIAEQHTGISADKIKCIYTLGNVDGVYNILVVYSGAKTKDVVINRVSCIVGTSCPASNCNYYDAFISMAGDDIYTDLDAIYRILAGIFLPYPLDDTYYMYCFFNAFRGIYIREDIEKVVALGFIETNVDILETLLDKYHGDNYIPTEEDICSVKKALKSENTSTKTE